MAKHEIKVYQFSNTPSLAFEPGGPLFGFLADSDLRVERETALYDALGASRDDEELTLGSLPNGHFALVGLTVEGHRFAVEV